MTTLNLLDGDARIARSVRAVSIEIDNEAMILDAETGQVTHLNKIGSAIWALLEDPVSFDQLCDRLTARFEVDRAACAADVDAFIDSVRGRGLVTVS